MKLLSETLPCKEQLFERMLSKSLVTRMRYVCMFTLLLLAAYYMLYLCGVLYEPTGLVLLLSDEVSFYALCLSAFLLNIFLLRRWFVLPDDEPNPYFLVSFVELLPAATVPEVKDVVQAAHGCRAPPISA